VKAKLTFTLVMASALIATACGGGGSTGDGSESAVESSVDTSGEASASTGGDSIRVAVTDPGLLIPGRQSVAFDFNMAVWTPLTFLQTDGTMEYLQAESIESDDAISWTVKLRDGWTFHDGTPVTAQSYVDSWNAVAYGPNAFENSGLLANIVGYEQVSPAEGEPVATEMSGLAVVDELTFTVDLVGPDGQFPLQVSQAQTAMFPMPASAFDDFAAYNLFPIGNGPFQMVDQYVETEPFAVTRYADFQGEVATVDSITFVPYTDAETAYTDVLAGNVDVASAPASKLTSAADDFGDRFYSFEAPGISFLGLPLWNEQYSDIRIRQAISMAIDRETISEVIYGGSLTPATAWTPPIEPGTPEGICGQYCDYDPEAAKALFDEAGGVEGGIEIYFPGGFGLDPLYEAISNQLRQNLGVESTVRASADFAEFLEARTSADIDGPFFSRWGALYPSQQATLRVFFIEGGGCANCIPLYTDEIAQAMAVADADLTGDGKAYADVQELIQADFPAPPLFFETYSYVTSEKVAELVTSAAGNPTFRSIILAE